MKKVFISLFLICTLVCQAQTYLKFKGSSTVLELKNSPVRVTQPADLQFTTTTTNTSINFTIVGISTKTLNIDWGDGNNQIITFTGSSQIISHTYTNVGKFNVFFTGDVNNITSFSISTALYTGTINQRHLLWTGLNDFTNTYANNNSGTLNLLPFKNSIYINDGSSTAKKFIINLNSICDTIKSFYINTVQPIITGDFNIIGNNITNYFYINNVTAYTALRGNNLEVTTLSPKITDLRLWNIGDSVIWDGYYNNKVLKTLVLFTGSYKRYNFVIDSLPNTLTVLGIIQGSSGITGSLDNLMAKAPSLTQIPYLTLCTNLNATFNSNYTKLTNCYFVDNNKFTGDVKYFKNCTYVQLSNLDSLYGSLDSLQAITNYLYIQRSDNKYANLKLELSTLKNTLIQCTINRIGSITYNGGTIPSFSNATSLIFNGNMTEAQLRLFLINWAAVATSKTCTCNFGGTNASIHVNSTDDPDLYNAIQTLQSLNKTLNYNSY